MVKPNWLKEISAANSRTEPSRRSLVPSPYAVWRRNYFALKAWQALHGALPQASGGAQAKTLANWLAKAKQLYKQGKLSSLVQT